LRIADCGLQIGWSGIPPGERRTGVAGPDLQSAIRNPQS